MKKIMIVFAMIVACSESNDPTPNPTPVVVAPIFGEYELAWEDNFDFIDTDKWNFETIAPNGDRWHNNELQYYTDRNAEIKDGVLQIIGKKEQFKGLSYTSSRITTQDKFEFRYGRVEARMKLPVDNGTWPALWMLGANIDLVGWPNCGEIDIMEHNGNNAGRVSSALHSQNSFGGNASHNATTIDPEGFHLWILEWDEVQMVFKVDGKTIHSANSTPPFNTEFFLLLNLAIGGDFVGDVDSDFESATYEIDYIKVYQRKQLN